MANSGASRGPDDTLQVERVRRLIERGLERFGRGELPEALAEWEHALMLDEHNAEARKLIGFVQDRLGAVMSAAAMEESFLLQAPSTEGAGRTGWALADAPGPRPAPGASSPDTPAVMSAEQADAEPEIAAPAERTWGGRGRVEPVGIPGEPEPPSSPAAPMAIPPEEITEPGPQAMKSALDDLDWSDVNAAIDPGGGGAAPAEGGAFDEFDNHPGRSRQVTQRSQIPAILAASSFADTGTPAGPPPPLDLWQTEPGAPVEPMNPSAASTRPVGGKPAPIVEPPTSGELPAFDDIVGDPSAEARQRASELIDRARAEFEAGNMEGAAEAAEFALTEGERAPPPGIAEVIEPAKPLLHRIFEAHVGPGQGVPAVTLTAHEISAMTFDHRTGFLLSRVDGDMTIDEILDVSGMGSFDTFRILSSLIRAGIVSMS